jgi:hypothetical protein
MITVKLPDGSTAQFPDGTPPEQIKAAIQKKFPPGPAARPYDPAAPETPGAFGTNPMAPELAGGAPPVSFDDYVRSFGSNTDQIPIVGPALMQGIKTAREKVQGLTPEQVDAEFAQAKAKAPGADFAGKMFYNIAPYAAGGAMAPKLFGMGEAVPFSAGLKPVVTDIAKRGLAAAASSYAIGVPDSIIRGADPMTAAKENIVPSLAVGGLPFLGAGVRGLGKALPALANWSTGDIAPTIKAFWNPEKAAQKATGRAFNADRSAGMAMDPADEAFARANGLDINNLDLGGPAVRNLARSAKATSPEANAALTSAVDRGAPGVDTEKFLIRLVGGSADDLALREGLQNQGRLHNAPAYNKAMSAPAAQSMFTPPLQEVMQSQAVQSAITDVMKTESNRAAIGGYVKPSMPFAKDQDGVWQIKTARTPHGSVYTPAAPNLAFWDQVKRNLDDQISQAQRSGAKSTAADLIGVKSKLVSELDRAVPEYRAARQGAAAFFGAEDAMDAGRKFAMQPKLTPEAKAAIAKLSPAERKAFEIGAASTAIDALKGKDTFASVKQVFQNPNAREFWLATLGPQRAAQLESYVKVQAIQEASKQAVLGGSQTYDLLVGGGLATGGFVAGQAGIDPRISGAAMFIGAARFAKGTLGKVVDRQVLTNVAKLLASGDKAALNKVIANATLSPKWRAVIDAVFEGMAATSRGAVMATVGSAPALATEPWPKTDTRDYSKGLPPPLSAGPRAAGS